ncbi:hypothetical protein ACFQI7_06155 [Paenibacillus allorhizosphaerae]|uniref:Uncharacterized protein n=1 Tax=Paenibacillus allorhizosphaerae TaxID=2849866 RepID=A0ABM8VFX0_9BACL|nr:hypothetical protein [Paenibacillus allorhizosphaerae]CAG7634624.1 hypothetical protein PAECIP111802_02048 [Paenibacillus allorhizosphaerae]
MAERGILAYFHSPQEAEGCVSKLKALRAIDVQIDKIGQYPGHGIDETYNPLSNSDFAGLAHLTLGAAPSSQDARILMAANPDASGMSDGGHDFYTDDMTRRDTLLTVVVDEATFDQALRVIEEAGGRI